MVGPEASHAALLGSTPLLDVHEMTNDLELETVGLVRSRERGVVQYKSCGCGSKHKLRFSARTVVQSRGRAGLVCNFILSPLGNTTRCPPSCRYQRLQGQTESCGSGHERVLHWQPTGPTPLNHRDDFSSMILVYRSCPMGVEISFFR